MNVKVKFINARSYDFTDTNGVRVQGCTALCYMPDSKDVIKVRVYNGSAIEGKKFGDDIEVVAIFTSKYVRYEV